MTTGGEVLFAADLSTILSAVALDRIRSSKVPENEVPIAGKEFSILEPRELPPCKAESGAFMAEKEWTRLFAHPYAKSSPETHGYLKPTKVTAPPYSTYAVPFWWMLRKNQKDIDPVTTRALAAG